MRKTKLNTDEYRRKLEHQIYLAQEHPIKIYDLADCNINQIPKGVFTYCKYLRKYSLNLSENKLSSFESGGNLEDLSCLGALILSRNLFQSLPDGITKLINLKKLLLDYNKLQKFPVVLVELPNLKILNLEGNYIKVVPREVRYFKNLENLNLLNNPLTTVAPELCEIDTIKVVKIEFNTNVKNIPKDIIESGFDVVWKYFFEVKKKPFRKICASEPQKQLERVNSDLSYTKIGEDIEREIMEHEENLLKIDIDNRRKSMDEIKKKQQAENDMISAILSQKKSDNDRLLDAIKYDEINTNELINKIIEYNNKAKKTEELKNMIDERNTSYIDFDLSLSRESRNEVLNSMRNLCKSATSDPFRQSIFITENNGPLTFTQVAEQKLAFQQLLYEKDSQLSRLRDGMEIIEKKLQQITVEDMIEGSLGSGFNDTNRTHLVNVLQELKKEKEAREVVLNAKIKQIESTKMDDQKDFWILQYQNLLDDKAKSDFEVKEFLKMANMEEWISVFLKYSYTIDIMVELTMDDLTQLNIRPDSTKQKFLAYLNEWKYNPIKSRCESQPSAPSMLNTLQDDDTQDYSTVPSAPPFSRTDSVVLARKEAECCICMNVEARILFLNCGHICCCKSCSVTVKQCPLCRQDIRQRVNLEFSI